jgi:hypothetical protein
VTEIQSKQVPRTTEGLEPCCRAACGSQLRGHYSVTTCWSIPSRLA